MLYFLIRISFTILTIALSMSLFKIVLSPLYQLWKSKKQLNLEFTTCPFFASTLKAQNPSAKGNGLISMRFRKIVYRFTNPDFFRTVLVRNCHDYLLHPYSFWSTISIFKMPRNDYLDLKVKLTQACETNEQVISKEVNDFLRVFKTDQTYPLAKFYSRTILRIIHLHFYDGDIPDNINNLIQNQIIIIKELYQWHTNTYQMLANETVKTRIYKAFFGKIEKQNKGSALIEKLQSNTQKIADFSKVLLFTQLLKLQQMMKKRTCIETLNDKVLVQTYMAFTLIGLGSVNSLFSSCLFNLTPKFAELLKTDKITYKQFISEVLRMYPPFYQLAWRQVVNEHQIFNHVMKKRDNIILSLIEPMRSPQMFENPEEFDPSRWTVDLEQIIVYQLFQRNNLKKNPFYFIPFGAGNRFCLAKDMSLMTIELTLKRMINLFSIERISQPNIDQQVFLGIDLETNYKILK